MMNPRSLEQFRQVVLQTVSVPDTEWNAFAAHLKEKTFAKQSCLIRAGEVSDHFYFIVNGFVRFFYSTEQGKEFNKHFVMENGFAGSFHSLVLEAPCAFFIQALEETRVLSIPHRVMRSFYDRHPCWERLGRKSAENMFLLKEAREKELLLDSLEVRYQRLLKNFPGLSDRIAQYHIASYLGVTDVALSRVRKKIFG